MSTNLTPDQFIARRDAARERLRHAVDPQTNRERYMVDWLIGCLIADEADEWSVMVERAYLRGIDIGRRAAERRRCGRVRPESGE